MVDDKLVIIECEEDIMVRHLTSLRSVEGEREMKEISFQSFEVINIEMVCPVRHELKNAEFLMASLQMP